MSLSNAYLILSSPQSLSVIIITLILIISWERPRLGFLLNFIWFPVHLAIWGIILIK